MSKWTPPTDARKVKKWTPPTDARKVESTGGDSVGKQEGSSEQSEQATKPLEQTGENKIEPIRIDKSYRPDNTPEYAKNSRFKEVDENINTYNEAISGVSKRIESLGGDREILEQQAEKLDAEFQELKTSEPKTQQELDIHGANVDDYNSRKEEFVGVAKNFDAGYNAAKKERYGLMLGDNAYKQEKSFIEQEKLIEEQEKIKDDLSYHKEYIDGLPLHQWIGIKAWGGMQQGIKNIGSSLKMKYADDSMKDAVDTDKMIERASSESTKEFLMGLKENQEKAAYELYQTSKEMSKESKDIADNYGLLNDVGQVEWSSPMDVLNFGITAAFEMLPQVPLGAYTLGAATYEQTSGDIMGSVIEGNVQKGINSGLSEDEAFKSAIQSDEINRAAIGLSSVGVAALDLIGADRLMGGLGKSTVKKMLINSIKKNGVEKFANTAKKFGTGIVVEEITEVGQELITKGGKEAGKGGSFTEGVKSITSHEILNIVAKTAFGAGTFSAVSAYSDNGTINKDNVESLILAAKDDKVFKNLEEQIALKKINGEITESEYAKKVTQLSSDIEYASKLDDNLSPEDKVKALDLIKSKYELENKLSGKEIISQENKSKLDNLTESISNFGKPKEETNEKPKQPATDVPSTIQDNVVELDIIRLDEEIDIKDEKSEPKQPATDVPSTRQDSEQETVNNLFDSRVSKVAAKFDGIIKKAIFKYGDGDRANKLRSDKESAISDLNNKREKRLSNISEPTANISEDEDVEISDSELLDLEDEILVEETTDELPEVKQQGTVSDSGKTYEIMSIATNKQGGKVVKAKEFSEVTEDNISDLQKGRKKKLSIGDKVYGTVKRYTGQVAETIAKDNAI